MAKRLLRYFLLLVIAAAGINLLANTAMYHPSRQKLPFTLPFERIGLPAANGQIIDAVFLPAKPGKETILFSHGNAGNITYFETLPRLYSKYGYGVLMYDYRGFGQSKGRISQKHIYQDAATALDFLISEKGLTPQQIILWGHSLGNSPTIELAVKNNALPFRAVVLQSPFTNIPQMAYALIARGYRQDSLGEKLIAALLTPLLFNKLHNNIGKIADVKAPLLVGYTTGDELIPWQMSQALADQHPNAVKFKSNEGSHNDFEWFENAAVAFLDKGE